MSTYNVSENILKKHFIGKTYKEFLDKITTPEIVIILSVDKVVTNQLLTKLQTNKNQIGISLTTPKLFNLARLSGLTKDLVIEWVKSNSHLAIISNIIIIENNKTNNTSDAMNSMDFSLENYKIDINKQLDNIENTLSSLEKKLNIN